MAAKTARVATDTYRFQVVLRVRHPTIDPREITNTLGIEPDHAWGCGDPRVSDTGQKLGGTRRNSYWSATLPEYSPRDLHRGLAEHGADEKRLAALAEALNDLPQYLTQQTVKLKRHREFLHRLCNEGGELSLVIEMAATPGAGMKFDPALLRQIVDLGLRMEFEFA